MKGFGPWIAFAPLLLGACEAESEECAKARNEASNVWKGVRDKAATLKHSGGPAFDALDENGKAAHVKHFTALEEQAEMLFKSFAYEKITWNTADPAKDKIRKLFDDYPRKEDHKGFQSVLDEAGAKHEAARKVCK